MSLDFEHFLGFNVMPNGVHFHPNGQNYLFAAGGHVVIADLTNPQSQTFLKSHDDRITSLDLSFSGKYVASGQKGTNANVIIWDFETKQPIYSFEEHDSMIQDISMSKDEKLCATVGDSIDGKLLVWDLSNGYIVASANKIPPGTTSVYCAGFLKDIKHRDTQHYLICTAGTDGITFWELDPFAGELVPTRLTANTPGTISRAITTMTVSRNHENLFCASTSGDFLVVNIRSRRILNAIPATRMGMPTIVCLPDDSVVVGCGDGTVKRFDINGKMMGNTELDAPVVSLSLCGDGLEIMSATNNGSIYRMNVKTLEHMVVAESHTASIIAVVFADQSSDKFASASQDGTIRVWDVLEYACTATARMKSTQARGSVPTCLHLSNILLSGWSDGKVLAHDADSGENLWVIDNAHNIAVTALTLSHNGRFILTGGMEGEIRLWEMRSRDLISHFKEHTQMVTSLLLVDDDTMALSASRDRNILRWDLRTERRVHCHSQRMGGINAIILTKDEQHTMSVGQEKSLVAWDNTIQTSNGNAVVSVQALDDNCSRDTVQADEGRCLQRSHCGRYVVTGGTAGILRLWSCVPVDAPFVQLASLAGHSAPINSVAFSPDDKQVISGGEDGSIFIWCLFSE